MWIVTILIVVAGAVLVYSFADRPERAREELMTRVQPGDPAEGVLALLQAEPLRCPGDQLSHLRESFPEGWSASGVDVALERLGRSTAERWLFGLEGGTPELCGSVERRTELGVDSAGSIVWFIPVLGRSFLRLPPWLQPAGEQDPGNDAPESNGSR